MQSNRSALRLSSAAVAIGLCLSPLLAQSKPPVAAVREVTDDYFGVKVVDPYRWMENAQDATFQTWLKGQASYTRAVLDRIPGRGKLQSRLQELADSSTVVAEAQRAGDQYFYFKTLPADNTRKLFVREGRNERLLVDPDKQSGAATHYSIDYFTPSIDGKFVAYGISPGGSENSTLRVIETATGRDLGESIDRAQFGAIAWLPDDKALLYNRLQKLPAGAQPGAKYLNSRAYLHRLGTNPDQDRPVLGRGVESGIDIAESDFPFVMTAAGSQWMAGVVAHGVQNEATIFVAPVSSLSAGQGAIRWRKLTDVPDDVTSLALRGSDVYLLSHHRASRFEVLRLTLPNGSVASAEVAVPATEAVIKNIAAARDALYLELLDGGIGRIQRLAYTKGAEARDARPAIRGRGFAAFDPPRTRRRGLPAHLVDEISRH